MCTRPNYMIWNGKYTHDDKIKLDFQPNCNYEKILKNDLPFVSIPCQQCLECRIQSARVWADRCVLEAKQYKDNYFVTLTYDDAHLPYKNGLQPRELQLFMKRLRKCFPGVKVRFFACGEYGDISLRPHYHLILFNCPLNDLSYKFKVEKDGKLVDHWRPVNDGDLKFSQTIFDAWQHKGMISVGKFNYDTAAYISQYVTKKINPKNKERYEKLGIEPEFLRMSNRPGIGASYFNDQQLDNDKIIVAGANEAHISQVPRYFDKLFVQKYGEEIFNKTVRYNRLLKRDIFRNNYNHDHKIKDKDNEAREYRLKRSQKLKTQI